MSTKERISFGFANVIRIILIVVGVVFLAFGVFFVFRTRNLADQAFRDAKNVYLALATADITRRERVSTIPRSITVFRRVLPKELKYSSTMRVHTG